MLTTTLLTLALTGAQATLVGWAQLEADRLMPGPHAGRMLDPVPGVELPFAGQPVQGISALVADEGGFLALTDNGFGDRERSADFLLRVYFLQVDFRTAKGGSGTIQVDGFLNLSDPHHHLGWTLTADSESFGAPGRQWPVDETLRVNRLLTGADLDPESLQKLDDGSLWVGDEYGPFLMQFDPDGAVAGPPLRVPGLVSELNPEPGCCPPELPRQAGSRGFEGLALSPTGERLYAMLEGALPGREGELYIYEADPRSLRFLNDSADQPAYRYRLEPSATAIGAFQLATDRIGLVLERDSAQGDKARHKRVYRVDLDQLDEDGYLIKQPIADLLDIADPDDLDGDGDQRFRFPHHTPEALVVLDRNTIGIANDNNLPFGRARGDGPDATEFILLRVDALW